MKTNIQAMPGGRSNLEVDDSVLEREIQGTDEERVLGGGHYINAAIALSLRVRLGVPAGTRNLGDWSYCTGFAILAKLT